MNLPVNTLLQGGKYKIIRFINSGGFGCTYEVEHTLMNSRVAIKEFFVKDLCERDESTSHISIISKNKASVVDKLKKKFLDEARSLFKMHHPGIVRVVDIFEENNTAYYVMEFVDGVSLHEMIKKQGLLSESDSLAYICQVADALRYVHSKNRLHLDIKPGNIMVDKEGKAILIDFGASKHYDEETGENTSTLLGINTKGYAPPEQMAQSFSTFSPSTDIYALGATLYKLLTGTTPIGANMRASGEELEAIPDTISEATRRAVIQSMDMNRNKRPQTIDAFLALLNAKKASVSSPQPVQVEEPAEEPAEEPEKVPAPPVVEETRFEESVEEEIVIESGKGKNKAKATSVKVSTQTPIPNDDEEEETYNQERPKKRVGLYITVAVIALVCFALGFIFVKQKPSNEKNQVVEIPTPTPPEPVLPDDTIDEDFEEPKDSIVVSTPPPPMPEPPTPDPEPPVSPTPDPESPVTSVQVTDPIVETPKPYQPTGTIIDGHEAVDLGLSVKWATCNIGATSPGDYGKYYAWGEVVTKSSYTMENSRTYETPQEYSIAGDSGKDAARAVWGGGWRMPTYDEIGELLTKCDWVETYKNGHKGFKVIGDNGNSIFLPYTGYYENSTLEGLGSLGYYWGSEPSTNNYVNSVALNHNKRTRGREWINRSFGCCIRPVID